jgi:hypothetical protein
MTAPLTTQEVCRLLAIPYGELMRLYSDFGEGLPVVKEGRALLWNAEAISLMRRILQEKKSKKGMRQTEDAQKYKEAVSSLRTAYVEIKRLGGNLEWLYKSLRDSPPAVTGFIHTLPDADHILLTPVGVLLSPTGRKWRASLPEAQLEALESTREAALIELRRLLFMSYSLLRDNPESDPDLWNVLRQLIRPKRRLPWLKRGEETETPEEQEGAETER